MNKTLIALLAAVSMFAFGAAQAADAPAADGAAKPAAEAKPANAKHHAKKAKKRACRRRRPCRQVIGAASFKKKAGFAPLFFRLTKPG